MFSGTLTTLILSAAIAGQVSLPLGNPPGEIPPTLLHAAPEDAVAAIVWAPSKAPSADSGNHFEQLLADDEVQIFLTAMEKQLDDLLNQAAAEDPDLAETRKALKEDLFGMVRQGGCLYLHSFDPTASPPKFQVGLVISPEDAELTKGFVARLSDYPDLPADKATVAGTDCYKAPGPDMDIYFGDYKGNFFIAISEEGTKALFDRITAAKTPAWIATLDKRISVKQTGGYAYLNFDAVKANLGPLAEMPEAKQIMDATGTSTAKSLGAVWGLDDTNLEVRVALELDGEPTGVFSCLNVKPLTLEEVGHLPKDAGIATIGAMDPLATYKGILQLAADIQPGAEFLIKGSVADFEEATDINFEKDVLGSLGGHWAAYFSYNDGGVLLAAALKDKAAATAVHGKLLSMAKQQADVMGTKPPVASRTYKGQTIYYYKPAADDLMRRDFMLPVAWCLTDEHLYLSLFPQTIQSQIDREAGGETLADDPGVKALFADGRAPLWIGYQDTQEILRHLLPLAYAGARMGIDASDWPSNAAIIPHMRSDLTAVYKTDYGVELTIKQSFPGSGMLLPVAMVGGGATMLPYGVQRDIERAMEDVFDPLGAARRRSFNNMRQIGLAALNHESATLDLPADICDKDGKPLLSWRVKMLPYLEQSRLYESFKLDEPWDSEHNLAVAKTMPEIFQSPGLETEEGMTRYQAVRGEDTAIPAIVDGKQPKANRIAAIRDGTSNTLWLIEAEAGVPWTKPADFTPDADDPMKGIAKRGSSFLALFVDCHTQSLPISISGDDLKALFTKSGGEVVDLWELDTEAGARAFGSVKDAIAEPVEEIEDFDVPDDGGFEKVEEFEFGPDIEEAPMR